MEAMGHGCGDTVIGEAPRPTCLGVEGRPTKRYSFDDGVLDFYQFYR